MIACVSLHNLHRDLFIFAGSGRFDDSSQRFRDAPLSTNDLPHILGSDVQLQNSAPFIAGFLHNNLLRVIH